MNIDHARRAVASAYAKQHCDDVTLTLIEERERENDALLGEIARSVRVSGVRTGRWVFGVTIAVALVVIQLVVVAGWAVSKRDRAFPPPTQPVVSTPSVKP